MKKITTIFLVLLISSVFFTKHVVADTIHVYFNDVVQDFDSLIFCHGDTTTLHGTGAGDGFGFISPSNGTYESVESITIIGDSVHYYNHEFNKDSVEYTTINGTWAYINPWAFNRHVRLYFTTPATEPFIDEELAICGLRDTLYAGDGNYQEGVYFKWENITTGNIISEGYYPNDTSLILDYTADIKLTITGGCNEIVDTINMTLTTTILPDLGPDITYCEELNMMMVTLSLTAVYDTYLWSDGSTEPILEVTAPGTYNVTVSNACLTASDEIVITHIDNPWLWLGYDQTICDGTSTTLDMGADYDVMSWSRIIDNDTIWGIASGRYLTINTDDHLLAFAGIIGCPSMMDDVTVTVINPYENNQVCIATVDTSGNNKVVWDRTFDVGIDFYNIYRLSDDYELIGSVNINEDPIFYDMGVDPMVSANRYKISAVDTCGNESELSYFHGTMHITSNQATSGGIDLTITDSYIEESGTYVLEKIYIFIDSLDNGEIAVIDSFNAAFNSYHVSDPYPGATYLAGAGLPWNCEGVKGVKTDKGGKLIGSISLSNKSVTTSNINYLNTIKISIYPNPSTGIFQIRSDIQDIQIKKIEIINTLGQVVLTVDDKKTIDLSDFNKGVYFANIKTTLGASIVVKKLILK